MNKEQRNQLNGIASSYKRFLELGMVGIANKLKEEYFLLKSEWGDKQ